ncbi:DinB family protein [Paenibacillus sp. 1011MAR3C5]|uniref:DinB family protein n=1 Tax=Paenibacillus sp. 1011MAR3C5 TaxID=1675787 RepID=UPI000E6B73C6|nr:DinB family protein [Paenibacillus sp. 1011MAR3C5]RJE89611.1 DinB family protein [Paenibacillus sp. 1011MAR3C5]
MLFDLQGETTMSPVVGMLYSAVRENSERLQWITSGMSQEEVDYRGPDHSFNSTAQLIKHIMYIDLNWAYRIQGQPLPPSLKEQHGPMIDEQNRLPMVKGIPLNTLMSHYAEVLNIVKEACTELGDADLDTVVTFGHKNEKRATIRWGLWHMADHSRYHQAHIHLLRKWYKENSESH